jgi:hypothetical protein
MPHKTPQAYHTCGVFPAAPSPIWKADFLRRLIFEPYGDCFSRLAPHKGPQKAITIIARKILVVIWHVLTHRVSDRNADPAQVERAFLKWATAHRLATSRGLSRTQFVHNALVLVGFRPPD